MLLRRKPKVETSSKDEIYKAGLISASQFCDVLAKALDHRQKGKPTFLKSLIKQAPSKVIINHSLEIGIQGTKKKPVLNYGDSNLNFYPVYQVELVDFINCRLREVIKQLEQYKLAGDKVLVIGGGSKLPLLSAALEKKGFLISDNGAFDNLIGLVGEVV